LDNIDPNSEKSENEKIRERLEFYKREIVDIINSKEYDRIVVVISKLIDLTEIVNLTYREDGVLGSKIRYITNTHFNLFPYYKEKNQNYLIEMEKACTELIHTLDFYLRSPRVFHNKQLKKSNKQKKTLFSNIKNIIHNKKYLEISINKDPFYEKLIIEINKAYNNDMHLTILLLLRKLFETIIADLLWKRYTDSSLIREENGKSKGLNKILKNAEDKIKKGNFTNDDKKILEYLEFIKTLKNSGNKSAHDITYDITPNEIEQIKKKANQAANFLFRTKDLLSSSIHS